MQQANDPIANAIAEIEKLRGQVPDAQIEVMLAPLRAQLAGPGLEAPGSRNTLGERSVQVAGDNAAPINTGTTVATEGGAFVDGAVEVRNGHFIGRDFIQYITQVVQGGEDPEEAKSVIALYLHALAADLAGLKLGEIDRGRPGDETGAAAARRCLRAAGHHLRDPGGHDAGGVAVARSPAAAGDVPSESSATRARSPPSRPWPPIAS